MRKLQSHSVSLTVRLTLANVHTGMDPFGIITIYLYIKRKKIFNNKCFYAKDTSLGLVVSCIMYFYGPPDYSQRAI